MLIENREGISASLESLINDKHRTYRLFAVNNKKTARLFDGAHSSVFKARGMDFEDVREYQQGDDARLVDWRITARQGKTVTKIFKEEKELRVCLLIDLRAPMHFGTKQAFKSVVAAHIVAVTAWSFIEKGDKVGGLILSDKGMQTFKPSRQRSPLMRFLHDISLQTEEKRDLKPIEPSVSLETACWKVRRFCKSRNVIFIVSDFLDLTQITLKVLASLSKNNEVILVNVYDQLEGNCPPPYLYQVTNGENTLTLDMTDKKVQEEYRNYFQERRRTLEDFAQKTHILYIPVSTAMNYLDVVSQALHRKEK